MAKSGLMVVNVDGHKYHVHSESYGCCPKCQTSWDSWREDFGFECPNCATKLKQLSRRQIVQMIRDCIEAGCLTEQYAYATPLMPTRIGI